MSAIIATFLSMCLLGHVSPSWAAEGRLVELPMKSIHKGDLFYVELEVGQREEAKTYNMIVASDYPVTWIQSSDYDKQHGYPKELPNDGQGHFIRPTGSYYGYNRMCLFNETIKVGPVQVEKQPIGVLYEYNGIQMSKASVDGTHGVLGLNDGVGEPLETVYLFKRLNQLEYIDELKYSIYINNSASGQDNERAGALVLGGINEKYYTGQFNYVKLYFDPNHEGYNNRTILINQLQLDWSKTNLSESLPWTRDNKMYDFDLPPTRLKLDSSSILFAGPKDDLDKLHLNMLEAEPIFRMNMYAFKDCRLDNKPDLVFSLMSGFDIRITPEDYVVEYQLHGRNICLSGLKPLVKEPASWVLGSKFMRKYYTLFDYENNVIGFATPR